MPEQDQLKIAFNVPELVTFKFNDPKTGTGQYGEWYMFAVENRGQDKVFFPSKYLHDKIQHFAPLQGKQLEIVKTEGNEGKVAWIVKLPGQPVSLQNAPRTDETMQKLREWASTVEMRLKSLEATVAGHGTLLVDLRGDQAVSLHESFPPDKNKDIPVI